MAKHPTHWRRRGGLWLPGPHALDRLPPTIREWGGGCFAGCCPCDCDCANCAPIDGEYINNAPCCWHVAISGIVATDPEDCKDCEKLNGKYYLRQDSGSAADPCLWVGTACYCETDQITLEVLHESENYKIRVTLGDYVWEKDYGSSPPNCCSLSSDQLTLVSGGSGCDATASSCSIAPIGDSRYCPSTIEVTFDGVESVDCDCIHCHYLNTTAFRLIGNPINGWSGSLCQGSIPYSLCDFDWMVARWVNLGDGAFCFELGIQNKANPMPSPWIVWKKDFTAEEFEDWTSFDGATLAFSEAGDFTDGSCTATESTAVASLVSLQALCPAPECTAEPPTGHICYCYQESKPTKVLVRVPNGYSYADISGEYLLDLASVNNCSHLIDVGTNDCADIGRILVYWCGTSNRYWEIEIRLSLKTAFGEYGFFEFRAAKPTCEQWGLRYDCWFGGKEFEVPYSARSAWFQCPGDWDGSPITIEAIE